MYGYYILAVICFISGVIVGQLREPIHAGTLVIDTTNPEKDTYSFNLDIPLDELPKKKAIVLHIDKK